MNRQTYMVFDVYSDTFQYVLYTHVLYIHIINAYTHTHSTILRIFRWSLNHIGCDTSIINIW